MTITEEPPSPSDPGGLLRLAATTTTPIRSRVSLGPLALLNLLGDYVVETESVLPRAQQDLDERHYELLELTAEFEIWAIHWPQGQGLELHDHGGAAGALWVVEGALVEHYVGDGGDGGDGRGIGRRNIVAGGGAAFGPSYIHDVVNVHPAPATSIHAYSPPMESMTFYRQDGHRLLVDRAEYRADPSWAP
jgi:predicted metal-dependent enzyme (double-stranded beta helix superfamily)